jgi:formylmethanofuran dehydrogenase subunit A
VDVKVNDNPQVRRDITEKFLKYYTVSEANYEVHEEGYIRNPFRIEVDATQ